MTTVTIYDPPMCCSTGVCGPEVDPKLAQFAGDLGWLKSQGFQIQRFNLAQDPSRFAENAAIKELLDRSDGDDLPAIMVGDRLAGWGRYPARDELAAMVGLKLQTHSDKTDALKIVKSTCCGESNLDGKASGC